MWRTLPIAQEDIDGFYNLGYSQEFIRYMCQVHNPNGRWLTVSENITNASKLGSKIRWHFESNDIYRWLFPETLPDSSCTWSTYSLHTKRPGSSTTASHGEGTFDFLGVGGALQSRHYNGGIIQDDIVGRKAIESQSVMDKTIDYHRLVVGAYDHEDGNDHDGNELVIGNRWGYNELNTWIRENEPWFEVTSHSAEGGCCDEHPPGIPIFSEEYSMEKLARWKKRLGAFRYSCQFLNCPMAPEDADFHKEDLGWFSLKKRDDGYVYIEHEVRSGVVKTDIRRNRLAVAIITDPAHSQNAAQGRCRHAIMAVGVSDDYDYYVLETWARSCNYTSYFSELYEFAKRWQTHNVGFETVCAQNFAAYHVQQLNTTQPWKIKIIPLMGEVEGPDGQLTRKKTWRIRNIIQPISESGRLWFQRKQMDLITEFETFPKGKFVDQLDCLAYAPQVLKAPQSMVQSIQNLMNNQMSARELGQRYSR
jgi:hypothetical protein